MKNVISTRWPLTKRKTGNMLKKFSEIISVCTEKVHVGVSYLEFIALAFDAFAWVSYTLGLRHVLALGMCLVLGMF